MFNTTFFPLPYAYFYLAPTPTPSPFPQPYLPSPTLQILKQQHNSELVMEKGEALGQTKATINKKAPRQCSVEKRRALKREKLRKKRERLDNFQRKKQKVDRNLPSNILRTFLNFMFQHLQAPNLCQKLFPLELQISYPIILQKLKYSLDYSKNYVRPSAIKSLCAQGLLTHPQALFLRIALKHFLLLRFPMMIVCSTKLKKKQRGDYLKTCRKLHSLFMCQEPS